MELRPAGIGHKKDALDRLIRSTGACKHSPRGFKLASGKTSNLYFDLRLLSGDPEGVHTAAEIFYHHIKKMPRVRAVGGLESGSIPIATAISQLSYLENQKNPANPKLTSFFVRKAPKPHGTEKRIEGRIAPHVVVVDDVITSGTSAVSAIDAVREEGHECECLMSVIFRGDKSDYEEITKSAKLRYIFAMERFAGPGEIAA